MAGKHKKHQQLRQKRVKTSIGTFDNTNNNQSTSDSTIETSRDKRISKKSKVQTPEPLHTNIEEESKKTKEKTRLKKRTRASCPSLDSDTGSKISKRRRRDTRNNVTTASELQSSAADVPAVASTAAAGPSAAVAAASTSGGSHSTATVTSTSKSRRRRSNMAHHAKSTDSPLLRSDAAAAAASSSINQASSSSSGASVKVISGPPGTSGSSTGKHAESDSSKSSSTVVNSSGASTSRSKREGSSKSKSKFPPFNVSSARDPLFLSNDNSFQGIVSSSGVDISHFQNYLSSRSIASADIGEQINKKIEELRTISGDRTQEYVIMTEINQHLLVSYEDSLNSLRVGELVNQVVTLIANCDDNLVDLKTICYNILLHLIEALPRSSDYLVSSLNMFLNKISNLFDFDSLEQIINVIERISRRHGQSVLQSGAFTAILNYYDFLTAPQQLTILNMISQCFHNLRPTDFSHIVDGIDNLTSRLKQSEPKCVDKVIQCFVRLVNAYQHDQQKLKRIAGNNLFANLQELLICSPPVISDVREIVQMMSVLCANCPDLALDLIKQNITQTVLCVCSAAGSAAVTLATSPATNSGGGGGLAANSYNYTRTVDETLALVTLVSELMPPLPANDDLFVINRVLHTRHHSQQQQIHYQQQMQAASATGSSSQVAASSHCDYVWYWFNSASKQWVPHPVSVCQLLERSFHNNDFELSCASGGASLNFNLILMQQEQPSEVTGGAIQFSDLKRVRQQHATKQHGSSTSKSHHDDVKKDARSRLMAQQCSLFELSTADNKDNLEMVELIRNLFPLVIDIYHEASSFQVKYKCLEAMIRMIYPTSSKVLNSVLNKASLSSLMASLLSSQDSAIIIHAIQMGSLIQKLPISLILNFKKEGVLHQLEKTLVVWRDKSCELEHRQLAEKSQFVAAAPAEDVDGQMDMIDYAQPLSLAEGSGHDHYMMLDTAASSSPTTPSNSGGGMVNNSTTQRFTNWVKRSSCIGGRTPIMHGDQLASSSASSTVNPHSIANTGSSASRNKKQKSEPDQALDMSLRTATTDSSALPSTVSTSRKINQIMSLLNLNSSSLASVYSSLEPQLHDKSPCEHNPNRELYCKQWILKYGARLDTVWKEIGNESVSEKICMLNTGGLGTGNQKKDIVYYLKEVSRELRSDKPANVISALKLYAELLTNDCYISVFEMETSGINEALLDFFASSSKRRDHLLRFLDIFNGPLQPQQKSPLVCLVSHLLMCLHQQEQFHVRMFQFPLAPPLASVVSSSNNNSTGGYQQGSVAAPNAGGERGSLHSRFSLTQALTEAVLGRMAAHHRRAHESGAYPSGGSGGGSSASLTRSLESSIIEARLLPSIVLESAGGLARGSTGSKLTEVHCHFACYPQDSHASDTELGYERWTGHAAEAVGFSASFNMIADLLSTVSNLEKVVTREISKNRRLNKRFGLLSKELSSINDSSDSDDDDDDEDEYHCDGMDESLMSGELDYQDDDDDDEDDEDDDMSDLADNGVLDISGGASSYSGAGTVPGNISRRHGSSSHRTSQRDTAFNLFHLASRSAAAPPPPITTRKGTRSKLRTKAPLTTTTTAAIASTSTASTSAKSSNPLSKFKETGFKAFSTRKSAAAKHSGRHTNDPESQASTPTPSASSIMPSSKLAAEVQDSQHIQQQHVAAGSSKYKTESLKPIVRVQILIGDQLLPSDMSLYQAIRRYSNHVSVFLASYSGGKTDQQLEEAINQIIWKSNHNLYYRPVSSIHHQVFAGGGGINTSSKQIYSGRSGLHPDSMTTSNFLALINSGASASTSYGRYHSIASSIHARSFIEPVSTSSAAAVVASDPVPAANTRQRNPQHKKNPAPPPPITNNSQHATRSPTSSAEVSHFATRNSGNKRRRKNNTESVPVIGRNSVNSHKILMDQLMEKLPYPVLIDFPAIFQPIPNITSSKMFDSHVELPTAAVNQTGGRSSDMSPNIPKTLETTLSLLRCLNALNKHWHVLNFNLNSNALIPEIEFRSQKLTSKVNRQLQDIFYVLAKNIPFWCVQLLHTCAFLFSLECRQNFFYLFNFDRARTLLYLEGANNPDSDNLLESSTSEIRRVRVQVNRTERLLEESELLLKNQSDPRVLLEISFSNEAGFGLGPTNEFYTQVSRCLMQSDLALWYTSAESPDEYVMAPAYGLYPKPVFNKSKKLDNKIRNKFLFLGRLMARALLDCRKLDLPLNPVFYKWLLNQDESINSADLFFIDPVLANQLRSLHELVDTKIQIESDDSLNPARKREAIDSLGIEDLQVVFVHPIYTHLELVKDGTNRLVTADNLATYLDLVSSISLVDGVRAQMDCVLEGFDSLLPGARRHLAALFEPASLDQLFCGGGSSTNHLSDESHQWDVRSLTEACTCDHGYTMTSRSILNLFEIMAEFDRDQRRSFVQFCTGSPRLPVGGFRSLKPPFKIVNKKEGGENPDNYLPSVMTCQNFLKLPDYSSKEIMRQRLLYALDEGQNAFYLS